MTQCYPEKQYKMKCLEVHQQKKVKKVKNKKEGKYPSQNVPLYHNQFATSFLGYKVMQILYNKLLQERLPTSTAGTK